MPNVTLRAFAPTDLRTVLPWFAHRDQREFAPDLPARELELMRTMPGTEHRGARILDRRAWLALDGDGAPVAFVAAEVYDRPPYLRADGRPQVPAPSWSGRTAGLILCVDPARWSRGYGRATLRAVAAATELVGVRWLMAGIDQDHTASARCAAAADFRPAAAQPDDEGMVSWIAAMA